MTSAPASPSKTTHTRDWGRLLLSARGRWLGAGFGLLCLGLLLIPDPGPVPGLRHLAFDTYQTLMPRTRASQPVVIVAIDDQSLARVGQWPWPRDQMAVLIDRIAARKPAVIGVDVIFAEPDRTSPERLAVQFRPSDPELAQRLQQAPSHDAVFADSLAQAPVVLGIIGSDVAGVGGEGLAPARIAGPPPSLQSFRTGERSLPEIDQAASGRGLFNAELDDGVVRRVPMVVLIAGYPVLSLPLECFRVAANETFFSLRTGRPGLLQIVIGDLVVPTQADGSLFVHYAGHQPQRYLSAVDVLEGHDDPDRIAGRIVLIGVTGQGLVDQQLTPNGEHLPGVEVHAEVIENVFDGSLLFRPRFARLLEALAFALLAVLAIAWVPRLEPLQSTLIYLISVLLLIGCGVTSYLWQHQLFDPLTPLLGLTALHAMLVLATMMVIELERRRLAARLLIERVESARTAGELEAARRIQTGMLPRPELVLADDRRIDLFAHMRPAREVGGDLYDFFYLPDRRLFIVVADVAGKGLAAALFMAVSKAITKSYSLRGRIDLENLLALINRELSRDNPDDLFVTMMAAVLDLDSGRLDYCNAGHEPLLLVRADNNVQVLDEGGGPPLCALQDATYLRASVLLRPGDWVALLSDGITESMSPEGDLFGREAMRSLLRAADRKDGSADRLGRHLLKRVAEFEAGTDQVDDQTLLLLHWLGPAA